MDYVVDLHIPIDKRYCGRPFYAKQDDLNSRYFRVVLTEKDKPIPYEKYGTILKVAIGITRGDDEAKAFEGVDNKDGSFTLPVEMWSTQLGDDLLYCDCMVFGVKDDGEHYCLRSAIFQVGVQAAGAPHKEILPPQKLDIISTLLVKVEELEKEITEAEENREKNETERIEEELKRKESEEERKSNETLRVVSEEERRSAEAQRASSELNRVEKEEARIAAEAERIANEVGRNEEERLRRENEEKRISAENKRISEEQKRTAAEVDRITAEIDRCERESERQTAEWKRELAETLRNKNMPHISTNGNWWIGDTDTKIKAQGTQVVLSDTKPFGPCLWIDSSGVRPIKPVDDVDAIILDLGGEGDVDGSEVLLKIDENTYPVENAEFEPAEPGSDTAKIKILN